jgi:hypothetical protein
MNASALQAFDASSVLAPSRTSGSFLQHRHSRILGVAAARILVTLADVRIVEIFAPQVYALVVQPDRGPAGGIELVLALLPRDRLPTAVTRCARSEADPHLLG